MKLQGLLQAKILFLGGGNMAKALVHGLINDGYDPKLIYIIDRNEQKRNYFATELKTHVGAEAETFFPQIDIIFIAIKPQGAQESCQFLKPYLASFKPIIISVMAGIKLQQLSNWLGEHLAIVRAMPNVPAIIQCGATGLCANGNMVTSQKNIIEQLLQTIGIIGWLPKEEQLDMVTALSGSGPAYYFYFMEIMQKVAIQNGIAEDIAKAFAAQTAYGAGKMAVNNLGNPIENLRAGVTSKNGTTEAALKSLEASNLSAILEQAMLAAMQKSQELSKANDDGKA